MSVLGEPQQSLALASNGVQIGLQKDYQLNMKSSSIKNWNLIRPSWTKKPISAEHGLTLNSKFTKTYLKKCYL